MRYLRTFPQDIRLFIGCIFAITVISIASYWSVYLMGYNGPRLSRVLLTDFLLLATFVITLTAAVAILTSAFISFYRRQLKLGSRRVVFCLVLILVTFMALLFLRWSTPFARGLRAKVAASVNIDQLTGWATDQFQMNSNGDIHILIYPNEVINVRGDQAMIDQIKPPDALNEIGSPYHIFMYTDAEGKQIMDIVWGSGFGHWGLRIGASDLNQYNRDDNVLEWKPRIWVLGLAGG